MALLNDLFGIQARGGCSCAGPYGHRLLGIDIERSHAFEREISRGCEGIKPGWVRVNFNYFISEAVFDFILDAVDLVARDGWRLLPQYRFEPADRPVAPPRPARPSRPCRSSTSATSTAAMRYAAHRHREPETRLADYLAEARALLASLAAGGRPPGRTRPRRPRARSTATSSTCAGSGSRARPRRRSPPMEGPT